LRRKHQNARNQNVIYKNSFGEIWCECGNRAHIYGFYPCDRQGNLLDGIDEAEFYRCDKCGSFVRDNDAELKEEPESEFAR
jgi:hypothetical protein